MNGSKGLALRNVNAWYGHAHVVQEVSLDIGAECLALMGRNGAGKTSLARTVMGLASPRANGMICVDGVDVSQMASHRRSRSGLGYVPQGRRVFNTVTVEEHLALTRRSHSTRWTDEKIYKLFPTLAERKTIVAGNLSGGQKSMLAFARALVTDPKCLILDEPTEGLAPAIVDEISRTIRKLVEANVPVLLIEQNIYAAEAASDRIAIMSAGRIVGSWPTEDFKQDHDIRDQYLGLSAIDAAS